MPYWVEILPHYYRFRSNARFRNFPGVCPLSHLVYVDYLTTQDPRNDPLANKQYASAPRRLKPSSLDNA